jgi:hypothetical protein
MHETPRVSEAGTLTLFLAVLRKAVEYSARLQVDGPRRAAWQRVLERVRLEPAADGFYRAWQGAPPDQAPSPWFLGSPYIGEALPWLDAEALRRCRDRFEARTSINFVWLNCIAACSELRLGRPDRAEQFLADSVENGVHGPGYFEECVPNGLSSLPPFATAHGAYLTACCEQIVRSDFWQPRVTVGYGVPSRLRLRTLRFRNLRARGGLLLSGCLAPRDVLLDLRQDGDAQEFELDLRLPAAAGTRFELTRDGIPCPWEHLGEGLRVRLALGRDGQTRLHLRT